MASGADWISALPEEALLHVLTFLPAHEAVQTSVLARRWRHLWRSVPRLRIVQQGRFETVDDMNKFVSHILLLRDHSSALEECKFDVQSHFTEDCKHVDLWLRQALCCRVRSLLFHSYEFSGLADAPLISHHLRKLSLDSVQLKDCFTDFSSCPVLEDLKMVSCGFGTKISSKSLKWLCISWCDFHWDTQGCISAPGLLSLEMADLDGGLCPLLESMPSLATAFIRIGRSCEDYSVMDDDDPSVIMDGISDAANLELTAEAHENNSPILEKLTLQLRKNAKHIMKVDGEGRSAPSIPREYCSASKHLKIVEVKCNEIDEMVHEVVNVLSSCGVRLDHINVKQWKSPSSCFSFEQKE